MTTHWTGIFPSLMICSFWFHHQKKIMQQHTATNLCCWKPFLLMQPMKLVGFRPLQLSESKELHGFRRKRMLVELSIVIASFWMEHRHLSSDRVRRCWWMCGKMFVDGCVGSGRFSGQFLENGHWIWVNFCLEEKHDWWTWLTILFQTEKKTMNFGKGRLVKCMKFTDQETWISIINVAKVGPFKMVKTNMINARNTPEVQGVCPWKKTPNNFPTKWNYIDRWSSKPSFFRIKMWQF